jgi:precorrin-6B methylase 2
MIDFHQQETYMTAFLSIRGLFVALLFSLIFPSSGVSAQSGKSDYQPQVGQEGKDVIWVPTPQALVEKMLDMAKVTAKDYVIDLGSGDGRTVITAAKRGAKALGIEYNPDMVELSKRNAAKTGVTDKASFMKADLFEADLSPATVITMFLLPDINLKLRPKILNLKPGTRIVSNSFTMGDWNADDTAVVKEGCVSYCTAYLWIVPAKVEGNWQLGDGTLTLKQTYQMVSGTLNRGGNAVQIADGKLDGDRISFSAGDARYTGRVTSNGMEGTINTGGEWKAAHASR